jgi:2-polyprenyl-3-methyl-5-hydroxy-6-metoxy-1,4-benzoquinol methylase
VTGPDYAAVYDPDTDFDSWYTRATGAAVARRLQPGDRVLELGCATGLMTASFVAAGATVVGVDRSEVYLRRARARGLDGARFVQGDVEAYDHGGPYDHVVATNLIHELPDPDRFLRRCLERLDVGGHLHLSLQNPYSVHRLAALELGLITDLREISARGQQFSTLQLYDAEQLADLGKAAGLTLVEQEGVMLKPLPNDRMAALPDLVLEGFVAVARHFPRHCAMNYLVFQR